MSPIDRTSPLPLYYQLKECIRADIEARGAQPGERLPGEFELCETYDVSRTVVRQALAELEYAGLVERVKGKGTFLARPKTAERLAQSLTGLHEDMAARGKELVSIVRRLEVIPADALLAAELKLDLQQPVIVIERLRLVDGEPWALTVTHIPHHLAPGLLQEDLTRNSLYDLLENKYGVRLVSGHRSIEAALASTAVAHALKIEPKAALIILRSVSTGVGGLPVESFVAYHRGDRSRFEVDLRRSTDPQLPSKPLVVLKTSG